MSATTIEERPYDGYRELSSRVGRTQVAITCPFCNARVIAYLWSLCGSGKRCTCGAKLNGYGTAQREVNDRPKEDS